MVYVFNAAAASNIVPETMPGKLFFEIKKYDNDYISKVLVHINWLCKFECFI